MGPSISGYFLPLSSKIPDLMCILFELLSLVTDMYFFVMFMFILPLNMQGTFLLLMFLLSIINMGQDAICNIDTHLSCPIYHSTIDTLRNLASLAYVPL